MDYGFEEGEEQIIISYCRSPDFSENDLLKEAALNTNPCIAKAICESITKDISYEKLCGKEYIPLTKADFYGYRRKCIDEFWRLIRLLGIWKY